jgi:hypothetical protein
MEVTVPRIDRVFRAKREKRSASNRSLESLEPLRLMVEQVDQAKEALLTAVPRGRGPGAPIAEALASFEEYLRAARGSLERRPPAAEAEGRALTVAIDESLRRAEALRLDASPEGYEELYALLGEILDPLDALEDVAGRLGLR